MNLLLFMLCPFVAFVNSLRNLQLKTNAIVFICFSALFGYCFTFQLTTADSYRYALTFFFSDNTFLSEIFYLYSEGLIVDLYKPFIYTVVKIFTNNPKVLFAVFGLIFGLFCYLSMRILIKERIGKNNIYFWILLLVFFSLNSLVNINGVRFWTATWVFFYSLVQYLIYNNRKGIIGLIVVPLFHFGFIIVTALAFLFRFCLFVNKKTLVGICFSFFLFSFTLSLILPQTTVQDLTTEDTVVASSAMNRKFHAYSDFSGQPKKDKRGETMYAQTNNMITKYREYMVKIMALVLCSIIYKKYKYLNSIDSTSILFSLTLFLFSFAFLSSSLMHSGLRFVIVSWLFLIYLLFRVYNLNRNSIWKKCIIWLIPTVSIYYVFFVVYNAPRFVDSLLWWMNLPYIIYNGWDFTPIFIS